jgi:hypothetical protein
MEVINGQYQTVGGKYPNVLGEGYQRPVGIERSGRQDVSVDFWGGGVG